MVTWNKVKCIIIFQLIFCFIVMCCACSENSESYANYHNDAKNVQLYSLESDRTTQDAISQFKKKYPDVTVNEQYVENFSDMRTKLNTELMAGDGPDVIKADLSIFNSIYKIMNTGVFFDMNEFIKNDKDFDMSVYNKTVMESGKWKGKQYFMPLGFTAPYLWTIKDALSKSNISFDMNNWTWEQMKQKASIFVKSSKSGEPRYVFQDKYSLLYCLLVSSGINYIDYEGKKASFDSPQFMELLETYKSLYNDLLSEKDVEKYSNGYYDMFKENSLLSVVGLDGKALNPGMLWMLNSSTSYFLKQQMLLYSFPTAKKGDKPSAKITSIAAINNNSESKHSAYNLVKMLLSKEAQTTDYFMNCEGIPVNNDAIDFMIKKYNGSEGVADMVGNSVKIPTVPLPKNLGEQAKKVVNGIGICEILDQSILQFIVNEVQDFVDGKISAKQTGQKINNKVQLFLSE